MGFLIFSCVRTIFLSSVYVGLHFFPIRNKLNLAHMVSRSFCPLPEGFGTADD